MKKLIVTIMGVMVLLLSFSMVSNALATDDGFYYKVTDNLITITGHKSITGDLIVPDEIDGISVTAIGANAFSDNPNIYNVILPDSVKTIGASAFARCERLESVAAPGAVSIERYAFYDCKVLTEITLGENIKNIGNLAFGATPAATADLVDGIYYIENLCWDTYSENIGSCPVVREGTTCIAYGAFGANQMTSIKLPESLRYIDSAAFANCGSLTGLVIPENVVEICNEAFRSCKALKGVYIPENVGYTGNPFKFCDNLTIYSTPNGQWHKYAMDYGFTFDTMDNNPAIVSVLAIDNTQNITVVAETKNTIGATLFAVAYDESDERVGVKSLVSGMTTFPSGKIDSVEIFCWESFASLKPCCTSVSADVIKKLQFSSISVSQTPEAQNHKGNLTDGNYNTVWACNGKGTIIIDLGKKTVLRNIDVYLNNYNDKRTLPIEILCSDDNTYWRSVLSETVAAEDEYMVSAVLNSAEEYRYIKIIVDGSSIGNWCSVAEVEVY